MVRRPDHTLRELGYGDRPVAEAARLDRTDERRSARINDMASTEPKPTTAEELLARSDREGRAELIRGRLIERTPAGEDHGKIAFLIGLHVGRFVHENRLGTLFAAETGFLLERDPDTVRAPDVAFIRKARGKPGPRRGYVEGAPDLAVEGISPDDTASGVVEKVEQWLQHGAGLVWVADPPTGTITAYTPDHHAAIYRPGETLPGEPVLPGVRLALSDVFDSA